MEKIIKKSKFEETWRRKKGLPWQHVITLTQNFSRILFSNKIY